MKRAVADRMFISGLVVETLIGVHDFERRAPRLLEVDLEFPCEVVAAAQADRLEDALDYDRLADEVRQFAHGACFRLIESFAEQLAARLLARFALPWVRIELRKPAAVVGARTVGVRIERRREHGPGSAC